MYIPKKYGLSRVNLCPFCNRTATAENQQGVPVCFKHTKIPLPELKCLCGDWLEIKKGKWGPYFNCLKCGNINFKKALEINPPIPPEPKPLNLGEKGLEKPKVSQRETEKNENKETQEPKEKTNNKTTQKYQKSSQTEKPQKEITITSDDPDFFD